MPEATVTPRGCFVLTTDLSAAAADAIRSALTFEKENQYIVVDTDASAVRAYVETDQRIWVPLHFAERTMTLDVTAWRDPPRHKLAAALPGLRATQAPVVAAVLECFGQPLGSALVVAPTGSGKTVMTLTVAAALRVRTVVVVPRQALADQWEAQIKRWLPDWRLGALKGAAKQTPGDIVVVVLRTMAMSEIPAAHFAGYDLLVFDEIHNIAAETMARALFRFQPHYLLGLSATPERKDGMHVLFKFFFAKTIAMGGALEKQQSHVWVYRFACKTRETHIRGGDKLNLSKMVPKTHVDDTARGGARAHQPAAQHHHALDRKAARGLIGDGRPARPARGAREAVSAGQRAAHGRDDAGGL